MPSRAILPAIMMSLVLGSSAFAQQSSPAASQQRLSPADTAFINDAAIGGAFDVEGGHLAEHNGANTMVREFGMRIARDRANADAALTTISKGNGVKAPSALDREHAQIFTRLVGLQGGRFDREYIRVMVKDLDQDAQKFAKEADSGNDEAVRRFARDNLAVIQHHDNLAHQIAQSMDMVGLSDR